MLGLRLPELLIILVVLVLMFGAKKLPELGDALGKGIRAFKRGSEKAFEKDDSDEAAVKTQQGQLREGSPITTSSSAPSDKSDQKVQARSNNGH